jgi:hypothetical protein
MLKNFITQIIITQLRNASYVTATNEDKDIVEQNLNRVVLYNANDLSCLCQCQGQLE